MIAARRERDGLFAPALFADPAWDLLLDLYAAHLEGRAVSVSSACIAANVPQTIALRWISVLECRGLIERVPGRVNGQRVILVLTDHAAKIMDRAIMAAAPLVGPVH